MSDTEQIAQAASAVEEAWDFTHDGDMVGVRRALSHARAALEAMEREPLEDVLRAQHVYNIQIEPAGPNYYAEVVSAAHDRRTGTGATIDDAIRAAVAAAEEER